MGTPTVRMKTLNQCQLPIPHPRRGTYLVDGRIINYYYRC